MLCDVVVLPWGAFLTDFVSTLSRDGRSSGSGNEGNRDQYMLYAALGTAAVIGGLAYFELGHREITWKECVTK